MRDALGTTGILTRHFFRRFFDNDTVQADGDTTTTVVRVLAMTAVPGLIVAFFIQNQYPQRTQWGAIQDQYFFVLLSFVVMGLVTIFEWEMLFPDRSDFLVLTPLPLRWTQLLSAKAAALFGFVLLFLMGSNLFGILFYPAVCAGALFRQICAHALAVMLAGSFACCCILLLNGLLLCLLDGPRFRLASPVVQLVSTCALLLFAVHYAKYGDATQQLLTQHLALARRAPPFWFLALYDRVLYGAAAPPFAAELAPYALCGTVLVVLAASAIYPLGWIRMRRLTVEGSSRRGGGPSNLVASGTHRMVRQPAGRAVFHFIGQTIRRNSRYGIYLAMYVGSGLALASACAFRAGRPPAQARLLLSNFGLHAVLPLLLFWIVAGLRMAFAFPINLPARWVFRVTGSDSRRCAAAARTWARIAALLTTVFVVSVCWIATSNARIIAVQMVVGSCLSLLLVDAFFFERSVPFITPRLPGRTNFALFLTLYLGVLTPFLIGVVYLELHMERHLWHLLLLVTAAVASHAGVTVLHRKPMEVEEEMEGYDGLFQVLGLS